MCIYIDVLVALNLFVNYFILLAVSKFLKNTVKKRRIILGALFGAICSLMILLPPLPFAVNMISKLLVALLSVLITFGAKNLLIFVKTTAAFFLISFCYCGAMICFWLIFTPKSMIIKNEVVYYNVSPLVLIISTLVCYFVLRIINRLSGREEPKKLICKININNNGESAEFYGKVDTGNSLEEPFCGAPVIVANKKALKNTIPAIDKVCAGKCGFRIIPYNSVGGSGTLKAFLPTYLFIDDVLQTDKIYIAVSENNSITGQFEAIINEKCIKEK